jgi:hypothetical protein
MLLTDGIRQALKDAAAALRGHARRVFMAKTVRNLGPGGQRFAERELGWNRRTIRIGEHELRRGVECVPAFNARGRKPIDARLPNLRADIKDLIDSQSQTDPRFESERVYCRLSASNVVELLIERKGYADLELPSNETIRNIINAEGYKLRKVQKTKPKKSPGNGRNLRADPQGERRRRCIGTRPADIGRLQGGGEDRGVLARRNKPGSGEGTGP